MRTKKALIEFLAERTGQSKSTTEAFLDALTDTLHKTLADGGECVVSGIGKFAVRERPARSGRNPATGEAIGIPARKVATFTPAKALKDTVANGS